MSNECKGRVFSTGWRQISTVPKDGTIVDLYSPKGGRVPDCWYDTDTRQWNTLSIGRDDMVASATHWMERPGEPFVFKPENDQPRFNYERAVAYALELGMPSATAQEEGCKHGSEYFCSRCDPFGSTRPATPWRTHDGIAQPLDLAPAQMVEFGDGSVVRADRCDWQFLSVYEWYYRPLLDPDGLPYCSAEGLGSRSQYVCADQTAVWQTDMKPRQLGAGWGGDGFCARAPDTHKKPGDWRQSLMRIWREG